jgi:hypothetical protein
MRAVWWWWDRSVEMATEARYPFPFFLSFPSFFSFSTFLCTCTISLVPTFESWASLSFASLIPFYFSSTVSSSSPDHGLAHPLRGKGAERSGYTTILLLQDLGQRQDGLVEMDRRSERDWTGYRVVIGAHAACSLVTRGWLWCFRLGFFFSLAFFFFLHSWRVLLELPSKIWWAWSGRAEGSAWDRSSGWGLLTMDW